MICTFQFFFHLFKCNNIYFDTHSFSILDTAIGNYCFLNII